MRIESILLLMTVVSVVESTKRAEVIQQQIQELMEKIKGKKVGMLTNPTSVDGSMSPLFNTIIQLAPKYNATLACFFAPQHGLRGDRQDGQGDDDYVDPLTNIQVYSLYGVRKAPTDAQIKNLDALIYDIQDVGARYYTFIWTLTYTIEVCAKNDVEVIVFDRPNPLGRAVEGCPLKIDAGLVGRLLPNQAFSIPQRYGLTVGELMLFLRPYLPWFKLTVIQMSQWYELSEYEWVLSSPNVPTLDTVFMYSGMGIIEATSVSNGRGTTKPFQITGNPKVNAEDILSYFKKHADETGYGKTFLIRPVYFMPTFNKYANEVCGGAEVHVIDRKKYQSVTVALHMIKAYLEAIKDGSMKITTGLDIMFGVRGTFENIRTKEVVALLKDCQAERELYMQMSQKVFLYEGVGQIEVKEE